MNEKWFALSVDKIEEKLQTNAAAGLSLKAARSRCNYKEKSFFRVKKRRVDKLLLDLFSDFFLIMLVILSFFSLFFEGEYIIGSAMLLLILVNLGLSFWIHYRNRRAIESISRFFAPTARVIRGGKLYVVDYKDVVPGDVIIVEKGDVLGCDARLVYSNNLYVDMRVDRQKTLSLKKYAEGGVDERTLHAKDMSNMLHAGSEIKGGSGRAIVVATGKYTYLGAMLGGMVDVPERSIPEGFSILKNKASKLGMLLLLLILPFTVFGLLFGHFTGGTLLLSEVLSVALAISASFMLSSFSTVFLAFFTSFMKRAALAQNPCVIRSVKAFDKLGNMDYLFMLDGSITTDGILHFDALMTADGEAKGFDHIGKTASMLGDMLALYDMAQKNAVSVGVESVGKYDIGFSEFIEKSRIDTEALKIRCKIQSFLPQADGKNDTLVFLDRGEKYEACFSYTDELLNKCGFALFAGVKKELSAEGRAAIKRNLENAMAYGRKAITVALKDKNGYCLVGTLLLREGIDTSVEKTLNLLKRNGVKVILFSNCVGRTTPAPEIPEVLRKGNCIYASEIIKRGLVLTDSFGEYDEYCCLNAEMIAELAKYVKSKNKTLAMIGFTDYASEAIQYADVFISCAPIQTQSYGRFDEEVKSLEIPGELSSVSCTQKVKLEADVLLMRPKNRNGGLEPIPRIMEYCKASYRNLKNFLLYLLCVQSMRIVTVAFPMFWGNSTADARVLIFLGFILDFITMLIFMSDTRKCRESVKAQNEEFKKFKLVNELNKNSPLFLSLLIGSVMTLLLPNIMSMFNVFGNYIYKAEFTYMSLALMHLLVLLCIYSGHLGNFKTHKKLFVTPLGIIEIIVIVVYTLLCFLIRPVGNFFGIIKNPLGYFLLSFVPAIAFALCFFLSSAAQKKKM